MTVLRIFFDAPPAASRAFAWALFDAHGVCFREGRGTVEHWPHGARREAVLAADLAPLMAFKLPPLSASRLDSAIRLQLEDRLATPLSAQQITIGAQQRDGWVRVVLTEQTLLKTLRQLDIDRVISEAELIDATTDAWHWCVSPEGRGFVRRDRNNGGSAFALDLPSTLPPPLQGEGWGGDGVSTSPSPPAQAPFSKGVSAKPAGVCSRQEERDANRANYDTLPPELTLALAAETAPPQTLHIHATLSAEILSSWQQANNVCRLTVGPPWHWTQADPALFAQATELLPQIEPTTSPLSRSSNGWRTAALLIGTALALHVVATVIVWSSSLWQHWQISRGWQALANETGLPVKKNATTIPAQWSRTYAEARHRAGLVAPDDALPLLARAAPSLRTLSQGALRNAVYADRAWTFEFSSLDTAAQKTLETNLRRTGLQPMSGSTAAGYRLRIQMQENAP